MILLTTFNAFQELPILLIVLGIILAIISVASYYLNWFKPQGNNDINTSSFKSEIKNKYQSKHFVKEQTYSNNPMRDTLKSMIRERMIGIIKETYEKNPTKNTPLEGLMIQEAIGTASVKYKESFLKERQKLQMTEQEIKSVVDEVTNELLERYLE